MKMFLSLIAYKKLKMDPILIEEAMLTFIEHYPQFIHHITLVEAVAIMEIFNDIEVVVGTISVTKDGNMSKCYSSLFWTESHR